MNASRTARERARTELVAEITAAARRQLAETGAAALSMRAVSREIGMVSSALHRYFPTRDDLLTALIVQSYEALAGAVGPAARAEPDPAGRWRAIARAVRTWALAHPHEYALIYGSPVPGYRAPAETVPSAARVIAPFAELLADAHAAGTLRVPEDTASAPAGDAARLRDALGTPDLPDAALLAGVTAWTGVFGHVSFELFGQFENVLEDRDAVFEGTVERLGRLAGLVP
ncbi:TetR family transcriptional regulator [Pseudonocardia sp. EC080610-09]|uniref:TetR/AcrR family transcriptional regulator n=1 Tax=unclassified Pseudonocardia TaxID=2619320 RepID=UPI0006CB813A|nr:MULTISPECIES: TetR/AcrR family transcriptional regulator [unclassified Pseudonocardia]ALE76612.1 TetR family transcriptional regulator [Pseudonocardia sp. EC080625-04]ALL78293.1 TetR family transcriptional regulator [Pseudonocardia sp. EC080610-09]ALL84494.1 TetR family transcriptional regulator [Pseudonocardia sp. EC080619-01]